MFIFYMFGFVIFYKLEKFLKFNFRKFFIDDDIVFYIVLYMYV